MKYFLLLILFINSPYLFSQKININVCNETSNIAARNNCVKGYYESLLLDELLNNSKTNNISIENPEHFELKIFLDQIGNSNTQEITTDNINIEKAIKKVINRIRPLDSFKNFNSKLLSDEISIEYTFPIKDFINKKTEDTLTNKLSTPKENIPFISIEKAPIFPGCYGNSNEGLKKCMSKFVVNHVKNNFNITIARKSKLKKGTVRISVQFKINKQGYVVDVKVRAPNIELEQETLRVVKAIPRMQPGLHEGKEVNVLYSLPIIF